MGRGGDELMRCTYYREQGQHNVWAKRGCKVLQRSALRAHEGSADHCLSKQKRAMRTTRKPFRHHVIEMRSEVEERLHTSVKLMWFVARHDWAISSYDSLCKLA